MFHSHLDCFTSASLPGTGSDMCKCAVLVYLYSYVCSQLSKYGALLADLLDLLLELHTRGAIPPDAAPVQLPSLACFPLGSAPLSSRRPVESEAVPAAPPSFGPGPGSCSGPGDPMPVEYWLHALAFDLGASHFARRDLARAFGAFTIASNVRLRFLSSLSRSHYISFSCDVM